MTAEQLLIRIEEMYGKTRAVHANGVFVLTVAVRGGVAVGCGSSVSNAVWDLHCDLSLPSVRYRVEGLTFQPWEVERRRRTDASRH